MAPNRFLNKVAKGLEDVILAIDSLYLYCDAVVN